jgi:hypothetical protein
VTEGREFLEVWFWNFNSFTFECWQKQFKIIWIVRWDGRKNAILRRQRICWEFRANLTKCQNRTETWKTWFFNNNFTSVVCDKPLVFESFFRFEKVLRSDLRFCCQIVEFVVKVVWHSYRSFL